MTLTGPLAKPAKIAIDFAVLSTAYGLAYLLRFEGSLSRNHFETALFSLPVVLGVQFLLLAICQVPSLCWRYIGLRDAGRIFTAVATACGLLVIWSSLAAPGFLFPHGPPPRGVFLIDFLLTLVGVIGMRVGIRLWYESSKRRRRETGSKYKVPTLLLGAGRAGSEVLKEIANHPELDVHPLGFLDDDASKTGMSIHGVPVLGTVEDIAKIAHLTGARQAIVTLGNPSTETLRRFVEQCKLASLTVKIIPGIREILESKVNLGTLREVAIEDLLRRPPVQLDAEALAAFVNGRRVLITGAGGSIGSELCRTICRYSPDSLLLVEHAENNLFHINRELIKDYPGIQVIPCLADVCDAPRIKQVFSWFQPEVVLHAAAHKHVPLMEDNPGEAIKNNVMGTRMVADLAHAHGVGEFVMISTDKAVNPTSVMGVSKRIAEIYIQTLSQRSPTRFVTVRFGNVLGSAGSVVPIFKEQIARGGPITITHPDMKRYFMTIPEACQLVLQAATMGQGGEIFILDMGEPVKIVDLARDLVRLSGLAAEDIPIKFTGIRPGEKLFEELALKDEIARKTKHPKIFIGRIKPCDGEQFDQDFLELLELADDANPQAILHKMKEMVPEYEPMSPILGTYVRSDAKHNGAVGSNGTVWNGPLAKASELKPFSTNGSKGEHSS